MNQRNHSVEAVRSQRCEASPGRVKMAVAEGFEPSDGGYPSHAFEACSLGRSDTPPRESLRITAD